MLLMNLENYILPETAKSVTIAAEKQSLKIKHIKIHFDNKRVVSSSYKTPKSV